MTWLSIVRDDVPTYIQFQNIHISKIIRHDHGPLHGFRLFLN